MATQTAFRSEETFTQEGFWEWLCERPDSDLNQYELIGGRIVMTPPAGWPHGGVEANVVHLLRGQARAGVPGSVFGSSTGFELPSGDTLEPDAAFISAARLAAGPAPVRGRYLRIVPDLVVEILSDASATRDRLQKRAVYAQNGVLEYWLVDTLRREVTVLYLDGAHFADDLVFTSGRLVSRVLPAIEADVAEVFEGFAAP